MRKKLFLHIFASLIVFFLALFISNRFASPVQGQTEQAQAQQKWRCLKSEQVGGKTKRPPPEVDLNVTGTGFPPNYDIYVVLCVPPKTKKNEKPKNYRCTTGNNEYDRLLFSADLTGKIAPLSFAVPKGATLNQKQQTSTGNLNVLVHMSNPEGHTNYAFFGVTINEPQLTNEGQANTLQYGTFQFSQDPSKCVSIRWDPYGRVFDSRSLEPISDVRVKLLDENKKLVILKGLFNPQKTEVDGQFNFSVKFKKDETERTFYLDVDTKPLQNAFPQQNYQHTFSANPNLHPNFVKAYSDIYKPGVPIVEKVGQPEHRDIPLDPGSGAEFHSDAQILSFGSVKLGAQTRFEGTISHPLSIAALVGEVSRKEVVRATSDNKGAWAILLDNSRIPQNEGLEPIAIKVDITKLAFKKEKNLFYSGALQFIDDIFTRLFKQLDIKASAQTTGPVTDRNPALQPILSYIEGYAYDQNGKIIPNATVKVKLEMSDGLYYQTKADEGGFFTISSEHLPIFAYYLEFTNPTSGISTKMTTSEFVQKNQDYLVANKINLMAATKNGQSLLPTPLVSPTVVQMISPTPAVLPGNQLNLILTVVVLVVLLGVAGGVLIYLKKKEAQTNNLP